MARAQPPFGLAPSTSPGSTRGPCARPQLRNKPVDLLTLTPESDVEVLVNQVVRQEALISENRKPQLRKLIYKLIEKIESHENQNFYLFKILRACAAAAFAGAMPLACALLPAPTPPRRRPASAGTSCR